MFICKRRLGNHLDLIASANPLENVLTFEQMLKESPIPLCNHIKLTQTEMLVVLFFPSRKSHYISHIGTPRLSYRALLWTAKILIMAI